MPDSTVFTRNLVTLSELLDRFKVSKKAVLSSWKPQWTVGAHFVIASRSHHLYDLQLIEHWLTHAKSNPELHQKAIEKTLARLDYLHEDVA